MARHVSDADYGYRPEYLHTTITSLEGFCDGYADATFAHHAEVVSQAAWAVAPFTIVLREFVATPNAVIMAGFPDGESIQTLRESISMRMAADGPQEYRSVDQSRIRNPAHMSAVLFVDPMAQRPQLLPYLLRATSFEPIAMTVTHLELVTYAFNPAHLDMTCHRKIPLGPADAS